MFEILSRSPTAFGPTKNFIKQVGRKRDQLVRDFGIYGDETKSIEMANELGEKILFDHECFHDKNFCGVVIVDADSTIEKLHFETVKRSIDLEFPVAIMSKRDFTDLLIEMDTVPDLLYYLKDRKVFLKSVFRDEARLFLDLNNRIERNMVGFYKLNDNSFPADTWLASANKDFWSRYRTEREQQIALRDRQNENSFVFDEIIDLLRIRNQPDDSTILHSWELASLSRRFRAVIAKKLRLAFDGMLAERGKRHFAYYNPSTGCWSIFYFRYGGDSRSFVEEAEALARMKTQVERVQQDFQFSVFCYGFRKSVLVTGNTFDECALRIEDATNYPEVSAEDYQVALSHFRGNTGEEKIFEFPS